MTETLSHSVSPARRTAVAPQRPWASPLLALLAAAIFVSPWDGASLVYVNAASLSDLWRFVTSHWVHWSPEHLVWSGGAFLVLGMVCERRGRRRFLVTTLASAIAIPIALRIFQPGLLSYGGLSGIDSALFGLICAQDAHAHLRNRSWKLVAVPTTLLAGFLAKIGYEFFAGAALFVSHTDTMVPVPLAHLVGAAVGMLASLDLHRGTGFRKAERSAPNSCHNRWPKQGA